MKMENLEITPMEQEGDSLNDFKHIIDKYKGLDFKNFSTLENNLSFLRETDDRLFNVWKKVFSGNNEEKSINKVKKIRDFIVKELSKKTDEPKNIFLLDIYTKGLIKDLKNEFSSSFVDLESFKIAPGQYAKFYSNNVLEISSPKDKKELESLVDFEDRLFNLDKEKLSADELRNYLIDSKLDKENNLENKIKKFLRPISNKDLYISQNKKISEENLNNFVLLQHKGVRSVFEQYFQIPLSHLSLAEQYNVFNYFKGIRNENVNNIQKFSIKFGINGFRTFLSIEHGDDKMGDKILELGEKLPKHIAEIVFAKYGEIIDLTDEITKILEERFGKDGENKELISNINDNLLKKGRDLLLESATSLEKCEGEECKKIGLQIKNKLSHINKENILLASTYKALIKKEGFKIESIKDVSLDMVSSKEDIEKYKEEMLRIFTENRENYPDDLLKETINEFSKALDEIENKQFYILKNKEEILAFMRFDILENGNYYAGSLNGRNEIQGLAIGGSFLKQLLINKSKERNIEAIVYEKNSMLQRYADEFGFKVVGEIENYKGTGQKFFKLLIKKDSLD